MIGTQSDYTEGGWLDAHVRLPDSQQHKTLDAVFERIEKVRRQRDENKTLQLPRSDLAAYAAAIWPPFQIARHHGR